MKIIKLLQLQTLEIKFTNSSSTFDTSRDELGFHLDLSSPPPAPLEDPAGRFRQLDLDEGSGRLESCAPSLGRGWKRGSLR